MQLFEEPQPERWAFERQTIPWESPEAEAGVGAMELLPKVLELWHRGPPPEVTPEAELQERRAAARLQTAESLLHQLDLMLRSIVGSFAPSNPRMAPVLNDRRKALLKRARAEASSGEDLDSMLVLFVAEFDQECRKAVTSGA